MRLKQLLIDLPELQPADLADVEIGGVGSDSRLVRPGWVFVAVRGEHVDGHDFLPAAAAAGAVLLVGEQPDPGLPVPYRQVKDSRHTLAHLAAAWQGYPARRLVMIGVTGTDGKTTTASLIHHVLAGSGQRAGLITTVSAVIGDTRVETGLHVTTPEAVLVQSLLRQMVDAGMTHAVLEATSHGLAQGRVAACDFDLAVITNITHEHLDYHGSFEAYRRAKAGLFAGLAETPEKAGAPERMAVLNADDGSYPYLKEVTQVRQLTYGLDPGAQIRGSGVIVDAQGIAFVIEAKDHRQAVRTGLVGRYNVPNVLAAYAAAVRGLGVSPAAAAAAIATFPGLPGRMERIDLGQPFLALVDFAHTPNALRQALAAAREAASGRVIAVFGSAGLRDRQKRRMMAEIAAKAADLSLLTAEDPRTEPLEAILEEMAQGALSAGGVEGRTFLRVPDRGEALRQAVGRARPGDVVIACGKGHEQSLCFGGVEYPWDERLALRAALAELLGVPGPAMPHLPTSV
ncbi:MAG: UDP-N-acetylmuramoyl-L-alanyl-D-glutamate--2,6-diaminopimelate ligase [Anaerolineales bacterium]|nr:UDP-N-acetylmuramoyl-L-alanyl-D-glutamate--2,6-diaminopimelate ligase [Anaerolineales bacterium]